MAHGGKPVSLLRQGHLETMLLTIPKLTARRSWLKAIRCLLQAAVPSMRKDNPAKGIDNIKLPKTDGHHSWTDDEIAQYREYWPIGTQQRLVFEFALETFRGGAKLFASGRSTLGTDGFGLSARMAAGMSLFRCQTNCGPQSRPCRKVI